MSKHRMPEYFADVKHYLLFACINVPSQASAADMQGPSTLLALSRIEADWHRYTATNSLM